MNTSKPFIAVIGLIGICTLTAGCSSAQSDWTNASRANTVSGYQSFLAEHPQDSHASEAKAMILQLQDNNDWQQAHNAGSAESYQSYLTQYPQGSHAQDAQNEMTRLNRAAAWKAAQDAGTAPAIQAFLQKYPSGPEIDQAKTRLAEMTGYRVHVANESSQARADRKLAQLKSHLGDQASTLAVTPDAAGKSFSIDSQGMSEQDAQAACDALKKKHEMCQVQKQ